MEDFDRPADMRREQQMPQADQDAELVGNAGREGHDVVDDAPGVDEGELEAQALIDQAYLADRRETLEHKLQHLEREDEDELLALAYTSFALTTFCAWPSIQSSALDWQRP